jgi:hypothetical protein
LPPEHLSESNILLQVCFAFIWRCIPAASLSALTGASVQRIGGMIIAARGFWFFWPVKRTPPVGFGRAFFLIVLVGQSKKHLTSGHSGLGSYKPKGDPVDIQMNNDD